MDLLEPSHVLLEAIHRTDGQSQLARREFLSFFTDDARTLIQKKNIGMNTAEASRYSRYALEASIATIIRYGWIPNLVERHLGDQAAIWKIRSGRFKDTDKQLYIKKLTRIIQCRRPGWSGKFCENDAAEVWGEFMLAIAKPRFKLKVSLFTFLRDLWLNYDRSQKRGKAIFNTIPEKNVDLGYTSPGYSFDESDVFEDFLYDVDDLVARETIGLGAPCSSFILLNQGYIGDVKDTPTEYSTEALEQLFRHAADLRYAGKSVRETAAALAISLNRGGRKSLICYDKLIHRIQQPFQRLMKQYLDENDDIKNIEGFGKLVELRWNEAIKRREEHNKQNQTQRAKKKRTL